MYDSVWYSKYIDISDSAAIIYKIIHLLYSLTNISKF